LETPPPDLKKVALSGLESEHFFSLFFAKKVATFSTSETPSRIEKNAQLSPISRFPGIGAPNRKKHRFRRLAGGYRLNRFCSAKPPCSGAIPRGRWCPGSQGTGKVAFFSRFRENGGSGGNRRFGRESTISPLQTLRFPPGNPLLSPYFFRRIRRSPYPSPTGLWGDVTHEVPDPQLSRKLRSGPSGDPKVPPSQPTFPDSRIRESGKVGLGW
jgi:hypothetical protein